VACGVQVLCFCVMPSHLHLVAMVSPGGKTLNVFMQSVKKRSTLAAREILKGPLWRRGFCDSFIGKEKVLVDVCIYVLNNPVEAGLVKDWRDYPHSWLSPDLGT
jgi:REP element-mobilizing transposase RayT